MYKKLCIDKFDKLSTQSISNYIIILKLTHSLPILKKNTVYNSNAGNDNECAIANVCIAISSVSMLYILVTLIDDDINKNTEKNNKKSAKIVMIISWPLHDQYHL